MNIVTNLEWKENYLDAIIVDMNNINENFSKQLLFSLKPGGHIITINDKVKYHRNTIALEDVGFEIRDQIIYFFGNDNKSLCLGRKTLTEKTIIDNVIKWGTGGINVDGCRIETDDNLGGGAYTSKDNMGTANYALKDGRKTLPKNNLGDFIQPEGRFPANILFDEEAAQVLDKQSGILSGQSTSKRKGGFKTEYVGGDNIKKYETDAYSDKGGASRFFYVTKTSNDLIDYLTKLITPENGTILIYKK